MFYMVTPLCNENKLITSVATDNKFMSPVHAIIMNKDQNITEGLVTSRVSPSNDPNSMGYHSNTLLSSD